MLCRIIVNIIAGGVSLGDELFKKFHMSGWVSRLYEPISMIAAHM